MHQIRTANCWPVESLGFWVPDSWLAIAMNVVISMCESNLV